MIAHQASKYYVFKMDLVKLLLLSIPLILAGLIQASVSFFVTLFLAHYGAEELAAGAIVSWVFTTLMVIIWGSLSAISTLVAIYHGEENETGIAHVLRDGILLALLFSIPTILILWETTQFLHWFGLPATTIELAKQYIFGLIWGVTPDFLGLVLLQFLMGLGHMRITLVFALILVPLNIFLNYVLLFGKLGFPKWGIAGIGWGTTITFWVTALGLLVYLILNKNYRHYFENALSLKPPYYIFKLCHIGIPAGLMFSLQVAFFLVITIFMGHFSTQVLAANQIALQYGWLSFVVLYAIAQAVTVTVGHALGKQNRVAAEKACYNGMIIVMSLIGLVSICYWLIPEKLISLDIDISDPKNAPIYFYAKQFLAFAGVFQLLEALRIILFGALRGLKDTRFSLWSSAFSFWIVALPLGYLLAIILNWGSVGLWWGITLSGLVSAPLLYFRFRYKVKEI